MGETIVKRKDNHSLFWPIVLIGVGLIWLLSNLNIISGANVAVLFRLWPLILIVVGLDLLFGRKSPVIGSLIGIGTVAVIVVLMIIGPSIGLGGTNLEVKTAEYSEPVGDASSARVNVKMAVGQMNVKALSDSSALIQADLRYVGEVAFEHDGQTDKVISLSQQDQNLNFGFDFISFLFNPDQNLRWDIGLSPEVPINLDISTGTGGGSLDLSKLKLTKLSVNSGTGGMDMRLPMMEMSYDATISSGTGGGTITLADNTAISLRINSGTGGFTVDVPDDAAVRLVASTGVGSISVSSNLERVGDKDDNFLGENGTWETPGFSSAERQIIIDFDGGTGGLTVR